MARTGGRGMEDDIQPLKAEDRGREEKERAKRTGMEKGMGVYTKVWGVN
jgi:hypothetical protein